MKYDEIKIGFKTPDLHQDIQIALANIPVKEDHIEASFLGNPDLNTNRKTVLNKLFNEIRSYEGNNRRKIDLVIFPEVSIPYAWMSDVVTWSRKYYIGVICGLEHQTKNKFAYNKILMSLPYKTKSGHKVCLPLNRLKNHYSPDEKFRLKNNHLKIPKWQVRYQLVRWRGASFAVYNCYELASIEDRSIFKGHVDFIICTEFNKDTNYFSNIVESAARDLHCYVIQVNGSQFGDTRVVSPSKTEKMNPIRIKGGDNLTFLTMELKLKALRDHQRKKYGLQKESEDFKPSPPGLRLKHIKTRIDLGKT